MGTWKSFSQKRCGVMTPPCIDARSKHGHNKIRARAEQDQNKVKACSERASDELSALQVAVLQTLIRP
jgi:hypothetical protein